MIVKPTTEGFGGRIPDGQWIDKSLRFRGSPAYLSRTPGGAGNRKTWTWSGWVKRGALGSYQSFLHCGTTSAAGNFGNFGFNSSDRFDLEVWAGAVVTSNMLFRDPSSWYHIVLAVDTTQAVDLNKVKLYVNGNIQSFATNSISTYYTLNYDTAFNQALQHSISSRNPYAADNFIDGYLSEVNFIDGQALEPTSFGRFTANGNWVPKQYTGSYSANGFYLPFKSTSNNPWVDPAAPTVAELGKDQAPISGAHTTANNWTPSGIGPLSGTTYDWMNDTPSNNYATLNNISPIYSAGTVYSSGNLNVTTDGINSNGNVRANLPIPNKGKFYIEMKATDLVTSTAGVANAQYGIINNVFSAYPTKQIAIRTTSDHSSGITSTDIYKDGIVQTTITNLALNDVIGVAADGELNTVQLFVNGVSKWSGSYNLSSEDFYFGFCGDNSAEGTRNAALQFNFGQRPFTYAPPAGFKALCSRNIR